MGEPGVDSVEWQEELDDIAEENEETEGEFNFERDITKRPIRGSFFTVRNTAVCGWVETLRAGVL